METLRIKRITKLDTTSKRYDIQTDKHHNFFFFLILVHNSIMMLWWNKYENKWSVSSSGTAFAEGGLADRIDTTFADLFWETWGKNSHQIDGLNKDINYIFEMTTPYNIIVTPHSESKITLIGARNVKTLNEFTYKGLMVISIENNIPLVDEFRFKNKTAQTLINTFKNMPFSEEGYVVLDDKLDSYSHNRVKIKNPAYVAVHHLTTGSRYNIMGVVKTNEVEEFAAAFGERREEVFELQAKYIKLTEDLEKSWDTLSYLKPKNITKEEKKKFAMNVFRVCETHNTVMFSGLMFALENGSKTDIKDYLFNMNNKVIYSILKQR